MDLHNQIVLGILKSAYANSKARQQKAAVKTDDIKQDSPIIEYHFDHSDYTTNLYTYIISFCSKNIDFHQEREDLHSLFYRVTNWLKAHPFELKASQLPAYYKSGNSILNARYAINPNSLSCTELICLPPHLSIPSFKNASQMVSSNEISQTYVEESLQCSSSVLNKDTVLLPSNIAYVLPFLLYITYHCHSSIDLLQRPSIPCCLISMLFYVVGPISALSIINFSSLSSKVELIFQRRGVHYEKGVTGCIAFATDIFVMRILLLIWRFLFLNEQSDKVVVDAVLLRRILFSFPSFLGPIQEDCMELFIAFPSPDPKLIK